TKGVGLCWGEWGNDCRSVWSNGEVVRNSESGAVTSKRILEKVVKQEGTSQPFSPSDSLGFGIRFSTQDFMNSFDSVAGIVSRCSSPILRESMGSLGVTAEHGGRTEVDNHNQIENRFHMYHPSKSRMWGVEDGELRPIITCFTVALGMKNAQASGGVGKREAIKNLSLLGS
nr:hypothetical protein [Tanacetum cinerariifolium]